MKSSAAPDKPNEKYNWKYFNISVWWEIVLVYTVKPTVYCIWVTHIGLTFLSKHF